MSTTFVIALAVTVVAVVAYHLVMLQRREKHRYRDMLRTEQLLRASDARFRDLFEQSPIAYQSLDERGRIIDINPEWCRLLGYAPAEILGASFGTLWSPPTRDDFESTFERFKAEGEVRGELDLQDKSGRALRVVLTGRVQRDEGGAFLRTHCILTDITARAQTEEALREKLRLREQLAQIAAAAPGLMYTFRMGLDGEFTMPWVSDAAHELFGLDRDRIATEANRVIAMAHPADIESLRETILRSAAELTPWHGYWRHLHPVKGVRWIEGRSTPQREADGSTVWHGFAMDVTDQHQADVRRAQDELLRRALVEESSDGIVIFDHEFRVIEVNHRFAEMLGYHPDEMLGLHTWDIEATFSEAEIRENFADLPGARGTFETRHRRKDGTLYDVEVSTSGTQIDGQNRYIAICRDITARKRAEAELLDRDQRLSDMSRCAHIGAWEFTLDGAGWWTEEVGRIHELDPGVEPSVAMGITYFEGESRTIIERVVREAVELARPYDEELRLRTAKGNLRWVRTLGFPIVEDGRVRGVRGTIQDVTDRRQAEDALRQSEDLFRRVFNQQFQLMALLTPDGHIRAINDLAVRTAGVPREALVGRPSWDNPVWHDDAGVEKRWKARLAAAAEQRGPLLEDTTIVLPDGTRRSVSSATTAIRNPAGDIAYFLVEATDTTDRRRAEAERAALFDQLLHAQKMESVGRLAGGIAHDFNNMLGVILGHAGLALDEAPHESTLRASLLEVESAAKRSVELTRQLLAFARRQTAAPRVLDLNATIGGMLSMLRRLIGEDIDLAWQPGDGLWPVRIDPVQVDQALANLCINARDAISGVGRIALSSENVEIGAAEAGRLLLRSPGRYVRLTVADDGCGMDDEVKQHLFEPFFSTKPTGSGTGLGLATVYGIVTQNEGSISVESTVGRGSVFSVHLPYCERAVEDESAAEATAPAPASRGETVLLVEDEPAILRLEARMLGRLGYDVVSAATPGDALRVADAHAGRIDLVMTDVVMPEMNGRELVEKLTDLRPGLKCLYMSGYTADVIARQGVLDDGIMFLQKPFSLQDLARHVRGAIDEAPAEHGRPSRA